MYSAAKYDLIMSELVVLYETRIDEQLTLEVRSTEAMESRLR